MEGVLVECGWAEEEFAAALELQAANTAMRKKAANIFKTESMSGFLGQTDFMTDSPSSN